MPVTVPASTELIVSSKATNERKKNHLEKYKQGVPGEVRPGEDNQKSHDRYYLVGAGQKESRQVGRGSRAGEAHSYFYIK